MAVGFPASIALAFPKLSWRTAGKGWRVEYGVATQDPECTADAQAAPPSVTPYDEMLTGAGEVREHYAGLHQRIATLGSGPIDLRRAI